MFRSEYNKHKYIFCKSIHSTQHSMLKRIEFMIFSKCSCYGLSNGGQADTCESSSLNYKLNVKIKSRNKNNEHSSWKSFDGITWTLKLFPFSFHFAMYVIMFPDQRGCVISNLKIKFTESNCRIVATHLSQIQ